MVHQRNWIIVAVVVFTLIAFIPFTQAEPPLKEGNPGLPGCLAKVAELQEQINILQALLDAMQNYAPVPQTGQTIPYAPGDDGNLKKGVVWPNPRFIDHEDGTVTDRLTGLMWAQDVQQIQGLMDWDSALIKCNGLVLAGYTDWRLPNIRELQSLIDYGNWDPVLPSNHPFINVDITLGHDEFWSSTTSGNRIPYIMHIIGGFVQEMGNPGPFHVWPVRGGR
jgi:hypothetical protein